eukprot:86339-Chlamydomonas_euryale.AAC.1
MPVHEKLFAETLDECTSMSGSTCVCVRTHACLLGPGDGAGIRGRKGRWGHASRDDNLPDRVSLRRRRQHPAPEPAGPSSSCPRQRLLRRRNMTQSTQTLSATPRGRGARTESPPQCTGRACTCGAVRRRLSEREGGARGGDVRVEQHEEGRLRAR